jgi:hypothetical protein
VTRTEDIFFAALLDTIGYWCIQVDSIDFKTSVFVFEMPQWSFDELQEAYDSAEGQGVTNVRMYAESFKKLSSFGKRAREKFDRRWVDTNWVNGKREEQWIE